MNCNISWWIMMLPNKSQLDLQSCIFDWLAATLRRRHMSTQPFYYFLDWAPSNGKFAVKSHSPERESW